MKKLFNLRKHLFSESENNENSEENELVNDEETIADEIDDNELDDEINEDELELDNDEEIDNDEAIDETAKTDDAGEVHIGEELKESEKADEEEEEDDEDDSDEEEYDEDMTVEDDDDSEDDEDDDDSEDDEDDDDSGDDGEFDESSEDGMSWEESRREYRRKRRIRNQIIAYGVVVVFVAVLAVSCVAAGRKISGIIKQNKQNEELLAENDLEQDGDIETQPEDILIEAPPEIEENTLDEQLEEIVNNCIAVMPLEDKVAGLFMITPEELTGVNTAVQAGEGTQEALNNYAVGGLVYFAENIIDKEQLTQMLSNTVSMSKYPIFLAVDEEGGSVSRVANSSIEVIKVDDMQTIGETGDTTAAYEAGVTIGSYLNELGFNLDFAPVADVVTSATSLSLGTRSFGTDPNLCSEMVSNLVEGIEGTSVSACLKHFPGIGSANGDTHEGRVEITKTLDEMKNSDFLPFQTGIEAGVDLIMVSHVTASEVDTEGLPSSLSKTIITDVLRTDLGYEGVVITDALNMGAISNYYTSEEAAVNAIMAGADMLLMPEDFKAAYEGLLTAIRDGRISEERINESLRRIYRIKYADKLN